MYNDNKAQQSKNRVHISWDILYLYIYIYIYIPAGGIYVIMYIYMYIYETEGLSYWR